jgi:hypothetical protein
MSRLKRVTAGVAALTLLALCSAGSALAVSITNYTPTSDFIPEVPNACVGTSITINGSGFVNDGGPVVVAFNGTPAVDVTIGSDSVIYARIPGNATNGYISVTTAKGTATAATPYVVDPCASTAGPVLLAPTKTTTTAKPKLKVIPKCKKGQKSTKARPCHK